MDTIQKAQNLAHESWTLYRTHFEKLFTTAAVVLVPVALFGFAVDLYLAFGLGGGAAGSDSPWGAVAHVLAALSFEIFLVLPLSVVAGFLAQAAQTCQLEAIAQGREPLPARQAWQKLGPLLVPLVTTAVLVSAMATLGMLALVVPGLWVLYRGTMVAQVAVHEGRTGWNAFRRSGELMEKVDNSFWVVVVLFVVGSYLGTSLIDSIFPAAIARLLMRVSQILVMPLPLITIWLTYKEIALGSGASGREDLEPA